MRAMRRIARPGAIVLFLIVLGPPSLGQSSSTLPARLTDLEFWALSSESSEPGGRWRSAEYTNLTSNELSFPSVFAELARRVKLGGVYLGVGPEQNFSYIGTVQPRLAVIVDIRRGNLDLQLMYKAIFELSKDRADFVSMLFARPRPDGLDSRSSAREIFDAFGASGASRALHAKHLAAIKELLTKTRGLPVPDGDLDGIEWTYGRFFTTSQYASAWQEYVELMSATDASGVSRSYLATEARFAAIRDLQRRNLIVPVVGDFAGPKAIRAIGEYVKARRATVSAFYLSNVEEYLRGEGKWPAFCQNVAALPLDASSVFIRSSSGGGGFGRGGRFVNSLGPMMEETRICAR